MKTLKKIIGDFGEDLAVKYLAQKGYRILDRNVKIGYQEIDIVARFDQKIVFIEVKTKTSNAFGCADEAITSRQIKNLKKALSIYLYKHRYSQNNIGLDLFAIDIDKFKKTAKIKHYKDIF